MQQVPSGFRKRKFLWKIFYPYLILIFISLIIFGIYASKIFKDFYFQKTVDEIKSQASIIAEEFSHNYIVLSDTSQIDFKLSRYGVLTGTRITLILPSGKVIADTKEDPARMELHSDRPEIIEALNGEMGYSIRYSHTLQTELIYIGVPVFASDQSIKAVLRTAISVEELEEEFSKTYYTIIAGGIGVLILISILGFFASRNLINPLTEMISAVESFSSGKLDKKIYPPKIKELREFAEALNAMASQIGEKLDIIGEQKNIQQTVLESMKEGVLAVDYDEKILLINSAAEEILSVSGKENKGKTLQEVVRVSDIHKFFEKIIRDAIPQEAEITIQHEKEKILQLRGSLLQGTDNEKLGILVVLNDVTGLKYLDSLKRDFIANVSHELKTPVTTIKGFIELLKEGAIDEPKNAERFVEIISKHTDRLNALIEDLLSLSRLEQAGIEKKLEFEEHKVRSIIKSAVEDFELKAKEKNIIIKTECSINLTANVNRPLLEQAIGNLIDNAIKYSPKRTDIDISAEVLNDELVISVEDEGYGISPEDLPRLFERFYRIDKSRSRADNGEGGTGLGLAIVKHIVQVHGGTVEVNSRLNRGSIFTIKIPSKAELKPA
jgi:two-component system phosphate regulon sensor histidine kinase PhoR